MDYIRYTSGGADSPPYTSHLFSVGAVCSMPQHFKQDLFFRQLTGFYFLYPGTQRGYLGSVITHIHNNPEYEASAHMHVRQSLTASCGIIARQCIIY